MNHEERRAEFKRLFDSIPGKNIKQRIDFVNSILFCEENTVRCWLMKDSDRPCPESKLKILRAALEKQQQQ